MSEKINDNRTTRLVFTALMATLVLLGTVLLRIPIPMTQGYVHLGDSMIYLGVLLLGRRSGAAAAGVGSALADVIGGYPFWAPWTFVIKLAMAYVTGLIIDRVSSHGDHRPSNALRITAMVIGGLIMAAGYFIAETIMYGSAAAAALGIPWNLGQFGVGIVLSITLSTLLVKLPLPAEH